MSNNNNNNAPFQVGQRVVALKSSTCRRLKKGDVVTVNSCNQCSCGVWFITLLEHRNESINDFTCWICGVHMKELEGVKYHGAFAKYFAPIEPRHQDVEIAEELLKERVPETLDVPVKKPQPAVTN